MGGTEEGLLPVAPGSWGGLRGSGPASLVRERPPSRVRACFPHAREAVEATPIVAGALRYAEWNTKCGGVDTIRMRYREWNTRRMEYAPLW